MISVEHISFSYNGKTPALDDVSLTVPDGEFLCILGANGSGKSTLGRHLNGLLMPQKGRVSVDDEDTAIEQARYNVRSKVAMVFQNPDDALVSTLVEDDVAFGPANLGIPSKELRRRVTQSLLAVGLQGFEKHDVNALSGGQKQRVCIAAALAMAPKVLVMDEPTAMLDPQGRESVLRIEKACQAQGMTIVHITHLMEEALLADRVAIMSEGRIVELGSPAEILTDQDRLTKWGLAAPSTVQLACALCERGVSVAPCLQKDRLKEQLCCLLSNR